jgi:hypothetical protein
MVQTCSKCSRANPSDAVYCYFDGFVLGGQSRNGGPVAIGAQAFAHPFVFPGGRQCRSFDELALACQDQWAAARDLLRQGYLEQFFSGLGRVDLALAAKAAAKFPDPDRGLDQLLEKLPTRVLDEPRLVLETQEINLGVLQVGALREFHLRMENQGMRLVHGTVTSIDGAWLALSEGADSQKHFQFQHDLALPVRVRADKLRANAKPLEAHLEVESNGGSFIVLVKAQVPVKPFPSGALAGAKSPRQAAEKAKANPKAAAELFENGAVAEWYKSNGWTYPVQGPAASGLGAIQQFFEALGLTPPPKVEASTNRIELSGSPGEQLRYSLEVKSQEKRPVYAHATSNQPWLEVSRAKLNGRVATINLAVPSVPNKEGETLTAKLIVQSNGNQRFVIPVTLQIGNSLVFGAPEPAPVVESLPQPAAAAPIIEAPLITPTRGSGQYRRRKGGAPTWLHLLPALLLLLTLLTAVVIDLLWKRPVEIAGTDDDIQQQEQLALGGGASLSQENPYDYSEATLKDPDPRLTLRYNADMKFGLEMSRERDPRNPDKFKKLTYEEAGNSNNTIIKIDGFEYYFGETTPSNRWVRGEKNKEIKNGMLSTMEFSRERVRVTQHVQIVPGQSGLLDTCLVHYTIRNQDTGKHRVGIRVMLDTYIGANDGVPFTIPGRKGFMNTKADFDTKQIPDYVEVIEKPEDPKDLGTVARLGLRHLRLPRVQLEDMERLLICRWPGNRARWEIDEPQSMDADQENKDSCVLMYWPYLSMNPKDRRDVGFTYGLGTLEIGPAGSSGDAGPALALSVPASVPPETEFVVTAYVWRGKKGDTVKLDVPAGLKLASGESDEKTIETEGGARSQVFWHLRSGRTGTYTLQATSGGAKAKPKQVVVKTTSIFG